MSVFRLFSFNSLASCRSVLCSRNALLTCEEQRATITYKTLEKLGIPIPPKRPMSPYIRFAQSIRSRVVESHPNLEPPNILKVIAQEWKEYDPEKKKELQRNYFLEMESYLVKNKEYKDSITPEQHEIIKIAKEKSKHSKEMSKLHDKRESLGRPKKPPTAFFNYMLEKKSNRDKSMKYSQWVSGIAKEWEVMSESEKQKYVQQQKADLENYNRQVQNWEEKMLREGHTDVLRSRNLANLDKSIKNKSKAKEVQ